MEAIRHNKRLLTTVAFYAVLLFVVYAIIKTYKYFRMLTAAQEKQLEVYPLLSRIRFRALFNAIDALGYEVLITSTVRPGSGRHGTKTAIDYNIIHKVTRKQYFMKTPKAEWEATGVPALIRKMKFRWGGDFKTPYIHKGITYPGYDPVHTDFAP